MENLLKYDNRSKGQFMLISAIVIGMILISVSSIISKANSREIKTNQIGYTLNDIRKEASKVDKNSQKDIRNFIRMVELIESYETEAVYWNSKNCFNVTLERPEERYELTCLKTS